MSFPYAAYAKIVHAARMDAQVNVEAEILDYREDANKSGLFYLKLRFMGRVDISDFSDGGTAVQKDAECNTVFSADIATFDESTGEVVVEVDSSSPCKCPYKDRKIVLNPPDYLKALDKFASEIAANSDAKAEARFCSLGSLINQTNYRKRKAQATPLLRSAQADAVTAAMERLFTFVWGPPGTGKSYTLGHITAELRSRRKKVLVIAHTNTGVDVTTFAIDDACSARGEQLADGELVRFTRRLSNHLEYSKRTHLLSFTNLLDKLLKDETELRHRRADIKQKLSQCQGATENRGLLSLELAKVECKISNIGELRKEEVAKLLREASVVCVSITGCLFNKLLESYRFDAVIIDEASLVPFAVWPWLLHAWHSGAQPRFVVAGDPMQLQPIFKRRAISCDDKMLKAWFESNIYAHLGIVSMQSALPLVASGTLVFLDEQFRMAHDIREAVSRVFYGGQLKGDGSILIPPWESDSNIPNGSLVAIDPKSCRIVPIGGCTRSVNVRNTNIESRNLVYNLVKRMVQSKQARPKEKLSILVVTPFRGQAKEYSMLFTGMSKPKNVVVRASTVHRCQGSEADVVFFDLVDASSWFVNKADAASLWCVACSRAKSQLFIVGDEHAMRQGNFSGRILEYLKFTRL